MTKILAVLLLLLSLAFISNAQSNDTTNIAKSTSDAVAHKKPRKGKDYFGLRTGYVAGLNYIKYPKEMSLTLGIRHGFSVGVFHYYQQKHLILLQELSFTSQGGTEKSMRTATYGIIYGQTIYNTMLCGNLKVLFGGKWGGFMFYSGPLIAYQFTNSYNGLNSTLRYRQSTDALFEVATGVGYELVGKTHKHAITFDVQFNHAALPTYAVFRDDNTRYNCSYYDKSLVVLMGFRF